MEESFRCGAPAIAVLVADDEELVRMVAVLDKSTRRGSVRVKDEWRGGRGRTIFRIIAVFLFL